MFTWLGSSKLNERGNYFMSKVAVHVNFLVLGKEEGEESKNLNFSVVW